MFVSCVCRRIVEGSGVSSACCAWRVSYVVGGCNVVATEHGRYGLSSMQKLWST